MIAVTIRIGPTTYVVSRLDVPNPGDLPWGSDECDAFVVILSHQLLTEELAGQISSRLVRLTTDWIEIMGDRSENLHDLIDDASVEAGRQAFVGEGIPMTAWYDDMRDMHAMIEYMRIGGQGVTNNKLIVVIAGLDQASRFAKEMQKVE